MIMRRYIRASFAVLLALIVSVSSFGVTSVAYAVTAGNIVTLSYNKRAKANTDATGYACGSVTPTTTASVDANPYYWYLRGGADWESYRFIYDQEDETPCYSLDPDAYFSGDTYSGKSPDDSGVWDGLSEEAKKIIKLALLYGFPNYDYNASGCDAYAATQAIIWEAVKGYRTMENGRTDDSFYDPSETYTYAGIRNKPAEAPYNSISEAISRHDTIPSFARENSETSNAEPVTLTYNAATGSWTGTFADSNGVADLFSAECGSEDVDVSIEGNTVTVTADSFDADGTIIELVKSDETGEQELTLLENASSGMACITGSESIDVRCYMSLRLESADPILTVEKKNRNGDPVEGAVYTVYKDISCTERIGELTTNASGRGVLPISAGAGTVYVKETDLSETAGALYKIDETVYTVDMGSVNTGTIETVDDWLDAGFTLVKMDNTGNYISGITFTAYSDPGCTEILNDTDGQDVVVTTDGGYASSGKISVGDTGSKKIYLKETALSSVAAERYSLDPTVYAVVLNAGQTAAVNQGDPIINDWNPATFDLFKTDKLGNKLSGVTFTAYTDAACTEVLKDVHGNDVILITDDDGYAESPNIEITNAEGFRVVYVRETALPEKYASTHIMSSAVITVDLITGKPTAIGTIENDIKDARFSLVKKDDTGNPLQGVQFTAYCDEGCTEVLKDVGGTDVVLITGADGSASSADIRILDPSLARNIYVKETMLPQSDTHNMASEIYPLTLRAGSASKLNNGRPIVNTWKPARFELIKEDSTGNRLEGVTFTAYEDAGCTTVLKDTSGADVTVTTGADGAALSAPIKVTEQDGTRLIFVMETGLSESAAAKYAMSDTVYPVTLSANGTAKVNGGNAIVNEWLPGKVSIIKKDSTGNALAGVVFTAYSDEGCTEALLDTDDQPVILTTDDNGYAESADVAINAGVHTVDGSREIYIRETFIPDALAEKYYMDPDVLTLTVNANTTTPYGEDIINRWKPARVGITKEDDTGNKLSGVQFTVYDDEECTVTVKDVNGEDVVLVTDTGGHAVSGNINVDEGCHGSDGSRTIYIRETFMPVELSLTHAINSTPIKVVLKASQTTNANNGSSFINYWKPARFKLVKVDETGNKLAGAVFTAYADAACTTILTDSTGSEVVLTTDANGRAESADIRILQADGQRIVYIKETAQSGELAATHEMNADVIPVILEAGKTASADDSDNIEGIVNTWKPGRFELVKKDSDGKVMPGVIFAAYEDEACETALKDVNGAEVIITTNSEGRAVSADISGMSADGTRTVYMKEVSVPAAETRDYEADDTVYRITLSAGETVTPDSGEEITNVIAHKYGKVSLVKENRAGDRLEGVVFTVYEDNGCTVAAKDASGNDAVLITNGDGYAETEYIPFPGSEQSHTYYLKETALGNAQQLSRELAVKRIYGNNRYETAAAVAEELARISGSPSEIFISSGTNYPDALSISGIAAMKGSPIVFWDGSGNTDDEAVEEFLSDHKAASAVIIGGHAAVPKDTEYKIVKLGIKNVDRLGGTDRFATMLKINEKYSEMFTGSKACAATGNNYPDALAGAVFAAKNKMPVILVPQTVGELSKALIEFTSENRYSGFFIFGGENAVAESVIDTLSVDSSAARNDPGGEDEEPEPPVYIDEVIFPLG